MAMMDIQVLRSWPGVTNGQMLTLGAARARRLIASGMAAEHTTAPSRTQSPPVAPVAHVARKRRYTPGQQKGKK